MSQSALMERPTVASAIETALIGGDLSRLTPEQRVSYYNQVCSSLGLNPLTKPFAYITLNGKLTLYALKDCTEQLRSTRKVSVTIAARELMEDCYVVSAKAMLPDGRCDESIGAVPMAGLKGEASANAMMKAETKAKRRVTLSICGLGMLDETEVDSITSEPAKAQNTVTIAASSNGKTSDFGSEDAGSTPAAAAIIDVETGEEKPAPPPGYHYVANYQLKNGWHEFDLLQYDAQGGSIHLSTKKELGFTAEQAQANRVPVKVTTALKRNARHGEAYVNSIDLLVPEAWKPYAKAPAKADADVLTTELEPPRCDVCGKVYAACRCDQEAF